MERKMQTVTCVDCGKEFEVLAEIVRPTPVCPRCRAIEREQWEARKAAAHENLARQIALDDAISYGEAEA